MRVEKFDERGRTPTAGAIGGLLTARYFEITSLTAGPIFTITAPTGRGDLAPTPWSRYYASIAMSGLFRPVGSVFTPATACRNGVTDPCIRVTGRVDDHVINSVGSSGLGTIIGLCSNASQERCGTNGGWNTTGRFVGVNELRSAPCVLCVPVLDVRYAIKFNAASEVARRS